MILIFSLDSDFTTQEVCKWLRYYKKDFYLISESNKIIEIDISNHKINISTQNGNIINLKSINSIWHRRGNFFFENENLLNDSNYFDNKLKNEMKVVNDYLMYTINNIDFINKDLNKLITLDLATDLGFKTPKSMVASKKKDLINFFNSKRLISKTLDEVIGLKDEDYFYSSTTFEVSLNELSENFKLSFFQELIEKKYEIRTFVYNGVCYSNAIFSQLDNNTKVDYRNYNYLNPNRQVAFKLPIEIENKIHLLLKKLGLSSGSIDFIYSIEEEFVFLEVNPLGQFGLLSTIGNYYCERSIAINL